jgi:SAM-dependent methyltransferase
MTSSDEGGERAATPDHVRENERYWNEMAHDWVAPGERGWSDEEPTWGIWGVPERELEMLPADMTGMRAVELGCGTAYVSAWMARRGATVAGIDASERQLATARRLADRHGIDLELVHGNAEATPFASGAYDVAISEYGAAIWCDPYSWIPEAHRLLKPGGRLVFLAHHPLASVCSPWDGSELVERLVRPWFGLHRLDWTEVEVDPGGIEFTLPLSDWMALFRRTGFAVEDLREPRPAEDVTETRFFASPDWARRWPSEIVWKLRKVEVPAGPK